MTGGESERGRQSTLEGNYDVSNELDRPNGGWLRAALFLPPLSLVRDSRLRSPITCKAISETREAPRGGAARPPLGPGYLLDL